MKKILLVFLSFSASFFGVCQELSIDEIGSDPAYCRLFDYQNGNGVVYGSATGGSPEYSYLWEHLETGEVSSAGIWGGRNPGTYQLTVTDAAGTVVSETITLDSLTPIANFQAYSDDLVEIPDGYIGFAPDTIGFINLSENCANPHNPLADPRYLWNLNHPEADWSITDVTDTQYKGFLYGGEFEVCLVAMNKNGCKDTSCAVIGLFGSMLSTDDVDQSGLFTIQSKSSTNEIIVTSENTNPLYLRIYSLSGQKIHEEQILNSTTTVPFNFNSGIYLYEFANSNGQIISSGKFNF
jgi:hypothetical protein